MLQTGFLVAAAALLLAAILIPVSPRLRAVLFTLFTGVAVLEIVSFFAG
jgi:hypothetical protein